MSIPPRDEPSTNQPEVKLLDRNAKESWALLEDLALCDNESWNDPRDFAKPFKAISLPQDVLSTSDRRLIELKNQVQCLMEAHLASKSSIQVNKITYSCDISSGPHDTQYCMENPKQAFVNYASSLTDKVGGKWYTFKPEQNNLGDTYNPSWKSYNQHNENDQSKIKKLTVNIIGTPRPKEPEQSLKDDFKDLHLNLPVLEVLAHSPTYNAILDKYAESLELGKNGSTFIQGEMPKKMKDLRLFALLCRLGNSEPFDTLGDLGSCVNIIPLYLFKKLTIKLLEETDHVFGLADGTKSYPVGIVKNVEVHIGRSVFGVKEIDLEGEEVPYWTTLGRRESYRPKLSTNGIGAQTPFYARKDLDHHLPREWELARYAKPNPFKDILVFRKMVEFLGAIPINLKGNMWESEDLIENHTNWDRPPKEGDSA
uniref:MAK10-like protein n=1 Tax=Tanacetum cinerariifolium TaxID=118510 RepID=A0A6L2KSK6_TANCI|nr:MAK10-like protein [Tanacetum cinerariifolium]